MKDKIKHTITAKLEKNAFSDEGDGLISFRNGLTITDNTEQRNGTRYDIKSMDISEYSGQLTANHSEKIEEIIGRVVNTRKVASRRVVVDGIQFAVEESALARFAYNMINGGYITDFSIETYGPWPDEDGVYHDSKLVGLSVVNIGNNKSATINKLAAQSIEEAKKDGLDTSIVEKNFLCYDDDKEQTVEALEPEKKTQQNSKKENTMPEETKEKVEKKEEAKAPAVDTNAIKEAMGEVIAPLKEEIDALKKEAFDKSAKEPEFSKGQPAKTKKNDFSGMDYKGVLDIQINGYLDYAIRGSQKGLLALNEANEHNLERLKQEGLVANQMTIADFGNFVINPEQLTEIQGYRSNYSALLAILSFQETLSTQMAWLERSGDIDMTSVEFCDDGADGNLKPISEYAANLKTSNLEELAAVTPVCNAATRFLAVDMIGDVTAGYALDYDRKKSQLFIARLQQAVDATGFKNPYDRTTATTGLTSFVTTLARVSESVERGVWIMNEKSRLQIVKDAIEAGISGPLAMTLQSGDMSPLLGKDYVIVPNELMPTLNSAETKTFVVDGVNVTIDQAVFYVDPMWFKGRISGGLQFDLSTEAAYEIDSTVRSAYQRNELVMRGSFFRGGAITDNSRVSSMFAAGIS